MSPIIGNPIRLVNSLTDLFSGNNRHMGTFGARLKQCRLLSKLSQAEVGRRVGISQGALSELENDKYPTSSFVPHLAALYGVEALWLAEGKGEKTRRVPAIPYGEPAVEAARLIDALDTADQEKLLIYVSVFCEIAKADRRAGERRSAARRSATECARDRRTY